MPDVPALIFEVLFDDEFASFNTDASITPHSNKYVVSAINDFADGEWRFKRFQRFIWNNIAQTALSSSERNSLAGDEMGALAEAAKKLRLTDEDDIGSGSELAEVVLYGLMRHHYRALPVVPKIFYKQNTQDYAKGADSVHIVLQSGGFSFWMGEAKFYNDIANARLSKIVESVGNALQTEKLQKENSIITSIRDLDILIDDEAILRAIRNLLCSDTPIDELKPHLHIPILLLHECAITQSCKKLTPKYRNSILEHHKERAQVYFKKQAQELGSKIFMYEDITFHLILMPVPNKKAIVDSFVSNVKHFQNQ